MAEQTLVGLRELDQVLDKERVIAPAPSPQGAILLCISEDAISTRNNLVSVLKRAGFEVDLIAANLQKPLELQAKPYRAVLLDVNRVGGAGFEICRRVREASMLPVLLILHGLARNDILRGFQAGADAYVLAPFDEREFQARLKGLLQRTPVKPPVV